MPNMQEVLKSFDKWINAANVGDFEDVPLTISKFGSEEVGKDKEIKFVLSFIETPLRLVLSKGRSQELLDIVGPKSEPLGAKIKLVQGVSHGRPAIQILPV
jgi:hypothetical protein